MSIHNSSDSKFLSAKMQFTLILSNQHIVVRLFCCSCNAAYFSMWKVSDLLDAISSSNLFSVIFEFSNLMIIYEVRMEIMKTHCHVDRKEGIVVAEMFYM